VASRQTLISRVGLARGLRQPNLVWLYDVRQTDDDEVVVATQWVGVDTLRARIEKRKAERAGWPLSVEEASGILQQIAYAVVQMHRDAEVLGDLRADTLVVTPEGLKLFNHGVGCALPRDRFLDALERAGEEMFVAPEVRGGEAPTARSDVYSLGALMHELVFGDPPSVTAPVLSPRSATRPQLAHVLARALDPEPFERPLSVDALLRELQPTLSEPEQPMPAPPQPKPEPEKAPEPPPQNRTVIGDVKLPGGIDIEAAVARAKAAAASGQAPSPAGWGGKNEAVTRELQMDEVESLLGKNETRQIDSNEIEELLKKAQDPTLEDKTPATPMHSPMIKEETTAPRPQLFGNTAEPEVLKPPVIEMRPEDKKTSEMSPVDFMGGHLAGSAPPPLWEDVKSKIERRERGEKRRPVLFIVVMVLVAGLVGGAGYLVVSGKAAELYSEYLGAASPDLLPSTTVLIPPPSPTAEVKPTAAPENIVDVAKPPPPAPCPAGTVLVAGKKPTCIDSHEYPGEGQLPRVQVSFPEAAQLCGARGARLCTDGEWERGCRGANNALYPYGASFTSSKCNAKGGGGKLLPSGSVPSCKSAAGALDMSGNAAEWVILETQQMPAIKGGSALAGDPDANCAHKLEARTLAGGGFVGFRCCREPKP
jgi:serine/threonine protein kinase